MNTRVDGRSQNDKIGKEREDSVLGILQTYLVGKQIEPTLLDTVPAKHMSIFECLCDTQPEGALVTNVRKKGGRGNNHDILLTYTLDGVSSCVHLEVKGGDHCSKIEDCPQVLSLAEKDAKTAPKCYPWQKRMMRFKLPVGVTHHISTKTTYGYSMILLMNHSMEISLQEMNISSMYTVQITKNTPGLNTQNIAHPRRALLAIW
jgi:hypothetical protein